MRKKRKRPKHKKGLSPEAKVTIIAGILSCITSLLQIIDRLLKD